MKNCTLLQACLLCLTLFYLPFPTHAEERLTYTQFARINRDYDDEKLSANAFEAVCREVLKKQNLNSAYKDRVLTRLAKVLADKKDFVAAKTFAEELIARNKFLGYSTLHYVLINEGKRDEARQAEIQASHTFGERKQRPLAYVKERLAVDNTLTTSELRRAALENQFAIEEMLKGKKVTLSGEISTIGKADELLVLMCYDTACAFDDSNTARFAQLEGGDLVLMSCQYIQVKDGTLIMSKCSFIDD